MQAHLGPLLFTHPLTSKQAFKQFKTFLSSFSAFLCSTGVSVVKTRPSAYHPVCSVKAAVGTALRCSLLGIETLTLTAAPPPPAASFAHLDSLVVSAHLKSAGVVCADGPLTC